MQTPAQLRSPERLAEGPVGPGRAALAPSSERAGADLPLDLQEGIAEKGVADARTGCLRWPEHFKLVNEATGELLPGSCRATNRCAYCARLFAVETSEMLLLDAMEDAPTLYVVLTARNLIEKPACRAMLRELRRRLSERWPDVRWAVLVEFQKRGALHLNLLTKGVPKDGATCEARTLWQLDRKGACPPCNAPGGRCYVCTVAAVWCSLGGVDARPSGQWGEAMNDEIGVVQYVTLHFMKPSQAPPIGWRGHRYSCSRDYLVRPAAVMRPEARASLRVKRSMHRGESLEVALHGEENRPTFALYREHGIQPGAEPVYGDEGRRKAARARSRFVRDYRDHLRGDLLERGRAVEHDATVTTDPTRQLVINGGIPDLGTKAV